MMLEEMESKIDFQITQHATLMKARNSCTLIFDPFPIVPMGKSLEWFEEYDRETHQKANDTSKKCASHTWSSWRNIWLDITSAKLTYTQTITCDEEAIPLIHGSHVVRYDCAMNFL